MNNCIFCKIIAKQIPTDFLYEDDEMVAFKDIFPKAKVHLLLVPKIHIPNLTALSQEHTTLISNLILRLPKLALLQSLDNGFRTVINTGSGGGQEIDHLHFHLLGGGMLPKM